MAPRTRLRMTRQRTVILEELASAGHPTASEIYDAVRRRLPRISLGTVYRNLDVLAQQGMIRRLALSGSAARFDATRGNHYHVRCVFCDRVEDVSPQPFPGMEAAVRKATDYEVTGVRFECFGVCPECRRTRSPVPEATPVPEGSDR